MSTTLIQTLTAALQLAQAEELKKTPVKKQKISVGADNRRKRLLKKRT